MNVYLITLQEKNEGVWKKIETAWPKRCHFVTDTLAFVAPEGITVPEEISEEIGMDKEEDVLGFVVQMDAYVGHSFVSTINWIDNAETEK